MTGIPSPSLPIEGKWRALGLLALGELLIMSLWFSGSAVVPQLTEAWALTPGMQSWMTMSVQLGFVAGALVSAALNLPDRVSTPKLIAGAALLGALLNAAITAVDGGGAALLLRFLTGAVLAGVYPPGMKLVAGWCRADRGFGIGLLVAALTVGSALPHLLNAVPSLGGLPPWRPTLLAASGLALAGGLLIVWTVREGPYLARAARFDWRHAAEALRHRPTRLANLGYLGHMWELYAMWAWVPLLLLTSYEDAGWDRADARLAGFFVIAIGSLGCVLAGRYADRLGRTRVTVWSLTVSGSCALLAGLFAAHPGWLTAICLLWGFAVVADSAQFSAAVSELGDPRYVGTALTVQTSLGFLLTLVSIRLVPVLVDAVGWTPALGMLALGPVFGGLSMLRLRRLPEAVRMASGNR